MQLDFKVEEQTLTLVSLKKVVADSVKYLTCKFTFSEDWNGVTKSATFFPVKGEPFTQPLVDDWCEVPHEVIKAPLFKVSVFGGELITTNIVIINVVASGYVKGETPKPPTPDVYAQILEKMTHTEEIAESLVEGEELRVNAEKERLEAEEYRQRSEEDRNNNEQLRDEHEINRVQAEQEREQTFETLKAEAEDAMNQVDGLLTWGSGAVNEFIQNSQQVLDGFNEQATEKLETFDKEFTQAIDDANHGMADFENRSDEALENFATQSAEELEKVQTATENANNATDRANEAVDNMPNVYANALKGTASGEVISLTDISPIEHNLGVKVSSKNLIPYPYIETTKTMNGITFTDNGDGSITIDGTATDLTQIRLFDGKDIISPNVTYTLSGCVDGSASTYDLRITDNISTAYMCRNSPVSFSYANTSKLIVYIVVRAGVKVENVTLYPMLEKGTTATAYTPFVADVSTTTLKAQGKNLIPYPYADTTKVMNGITFTDNGDGSITVKGTATGSSNFKLMNNADFGLSFGSGSNWNAKGGTNGIYTTNKGLYYNANNKMLTINVANGATVNETLYPQLEVGTTQTSYEPYIEPTSYTPNADGTVEGVKSIYPNTTLLTDTSGVLVECEYNKDTNKVIENLVNAIISLGGNV